MDLRAELLLVLVLALQVLAHGWGDVRDCSMRPASRCERRRLFPASSSTRSFRPARGERPSETMRGSNKPVVSPSSESAPCPAFCPLS